MKINEKCADSVSFDGENITINEYYHIAISRITTKEKLLAWIDHLLEKNWITTDHLQQVIEISTKYHGYNLHEDI